MITVTGTFEAIIGSTSGSVQFELINFGTDVPRVSGTGVLTSLKTTSAVGTSFTVNIFGNDVITPANTYYMVTFFDANGNVASTAPYSFTGAGPYDLSSTSPINPVPADAINNAVLLNPAGDQKILTYALTIQGGIYLGNTHTISFLPSLTANRVCTIPDADCVLVVPGSAGAHQWATGVNASGVITYSRPSFADLSGNISVSQMNSGTNASTSTFWRGDGTWVKSAATALDVNQTSHGFSVGQAIYYNGTTWALAKANAASTLGLGIVSAVADANDFTVAFAGSISGLAGLTAGQYYYVSDSVAGALTSTEPSAAGSYSNPILFALSTTSGIVLPFRPSAIPTAASTQLANTAFMGPTTGGAALPAFRTLVNADIPATLTGKTLDANSNTFQNLIPTIVMKKGTGAGAYTTSSSSAVDVDATNLSYTTTIPVGWCLAVFATGFGSVQTGSQDVFYSLQDSVLGTLQEIGAQPKSVTDLVPIALNYVIVGDGASHTVRWQFRTQNAADACVLNNGSSIQIPVMIFQLMKTN